MSEAKKITLGNKDYKYECIEDLEALAAMMDHVIAAGHQNMRKYYKKLKDHPEKEGVYDELIEIFASGIEKANKDRLTIQRAIDNFEADFELVEADEERKE